MKINEAQEKVDKIIRAYGGYWEPLSMLARLTEEVGELSRAMNIEFGGKRKKHDDDRRELREEIADVIFTSLALANTLKIDVAEELDKKISKDYNKCKGVYDDNTNIK
ncbi:MAG: MazG nucleotide pyrophosphohydrolase domain-containing protein [Nanoarchaeota archaeon]|nr:MazG nucleotide pyrophosphohydrolase domain-containing protein [Nanoarchaeota archaeon]